MFVVNLKKKKIMGKDHELLEAARNGNIGIVEKILLHKSKKSGPLARFGLNSKLI